MRKIWNMEEEVFILRNWHEMSCKELAEHFGLTVSQVRTKKYNLRKKYNNDKPPAENEIQNMIKDCIKHHAEMREKERIIEEQNSFIISNYREMTNLEMSEELGVTEAAVATRRARLIERGLIEKVSTNTYKRILDMDVKVPEIQQIPVEVLENQQDLKSEIKKLDEKLKIGKAYKISHIVRNEKITFAGKLVNKMDKFYIFQGKYRESFLKMDLITGEYTIKEA